MKKNKLFEVAALIPFVLGNFTAIPVYAEVTDYQEADTSAEETSAECQVIYKSTYDFSEEIPKYPELEVTASGYEGVYDGKPHGITVVCNTEGATIMKVSIIISIIIHLLWAVGIKARQCDYY